MAFYRQCFLRHNLEQGIQFQTTWIPEQFAVKGKTLKLKDDNGIWVDGWVVDRVYQRDVPEKHLPDSHIEIKAHRRNTGDSLRKAVT